MTKGGLTNFKIDELKKDTEGLSSDMKLVLNNHLPHIREDIATLSGKVDVLDTKLKYSLIANAVQIVALIIGLVLLLR